MTLQELRERLGLTEGALIDSNHGFTDILGVVDDEVSLGIIATGRIVKISCTELIQMMNKEA